MTYQKGHKLSPEHLAKMRAGRKAASGILQKRTSRTVLTNNFIAKLCEHFDEHGWDAIRIVFHEEPTTYLKLVASLCPREFLVEAVNPLSDLSDDDLLVVLEKLRRLKTINPAPAPASPLIEHEHANGHAGD